MHRFPRAAPLGLAAILASLALAGCLSDTAPPGGDGNGPPASITDCPLSVLLTRALGAMACNVEVTIANGPANEVHLAVNPTDPKNLVGGAKDYTLGETMPCHVHNVWAGQYWSNDGGRTWGNALVQGHPGDSRESPLSAYRCSSDPVLSYARDGTAYYNGLAVEPTPEEAQDTLGRLGAASSAIWVARSTDGGSTYETPVIVHQCQAPACFDDKQWIAVDPNDGTLYVTWALFAPLVDAGVGVATGHIVASRSDDGGATWTPPVDVSPPLEAAVLNQGNTPAVAPDGTVFVTWFDLLNNRLVFAKSENRGLTWTLPEEIATIAPVPGTPPNGDFRTPTLTTMAIDHSGGARDGTVYIAWQDYATGDSDILVVSSSDGGATWSAPARVNVVFENDQFFPSLTVAPNGRVDVIFYDRSDDPDNTNMTLAYAWSDDGGETFDQVRVGDELFDGDLGFHQSGVPFIGDYLGVASTETTVHAFWADTRKGESDVFTAAIRHDR